MEYVITRLEDPHPRTGNRLFPAAAWADRPESMANEVCFLLNPDDSWSTVNKVKKHNEGETTAFVTLFTTEGGKFPTEWSKMVYITDEQLERIVGANYEKMKTDLESRDMPQSVLTQALAHLKSMSNTDHTYPTQYELRAQGQEFVDMQPVAWAVAGTDKELVKHLPIRTEDPFVDGLSPDVIDIIEMADRAFPDNAPHHWKVLFG